MTSTIPLQKSVSLGKIPFNKEIVLSEINKKGSYTTDECIIKKWEGDEQNAQMYIANMKYEDLTFIGILNGLFERDGYCLNEFPNGDLYFGYYSSDIKSKHGLYTFNPQITETSISQEMYFGYWQDDQRQGRGINLWVNQPSNINLFHDFDLLNLNAVIGEFDKGKPKKATILSKEGNDYYCYHGTFTANGAKSGNKCFYYSASQEKLLFGEFAVNKFEGGFCALFNDDGEIVEISKLEKGKVYKESEINENEVKSKKEIMTNFRNISLGKDYFEQLIYCFQVVLNFRDKYMIDIDILNSEKYLDIMSISFSYLKVGIYRDIEKYLKY